MESTGTVKQVKVQLRLQGVDPSTVTVRGHCTLHKRRTADLLHRQDPLYWLKGGKYVPFRKDDWAGHPSACRQLREC